MIEHDADWTGKWMIDKFGDCADVESVKLILPRYIQVIRKTLSPIIVAATNIPVVDEFVVNDLVQGGDNVGFVVNFFKNSVLKNEGLLRSIMLRVPVGSFGDLKNATKLGDVSTYLPTEHAYIQRVLNQHTSISYFIRQEDRIYEIFRTNSLPPITACFVDDYELGAEGVRNAIAVNGDFDWLVRTSPYGKLLSSAHEAAKYTKCKVFDFRNFLGRLNSP
jgi:hypothetical protein